MLLELVRIRFGVTVRVESVWLCGYLCKLSAQNRNKCHYGKSPQKQSTGEHLILAQLIYQPNGKNTQCVNPKMVSIPQHLKGANCCETGTGLSSEERQAGEVEWRQKKKRRLGDKNLLYFNIVDKIT